MSNSSDIDDDFESDMEDDSMVEDSPVSLANLENIYDIETLEKLTNEKVNTIFDPDCVRKRSNWSKSANVYKFDTDQFNPKILLEDIPSHSPKLDALLSKIEKLDANDMQQHGKLFKHFIFSDLKSSSFGSKLVAGALMAKGFRLGYTAENRSKSASPMIMNAPPVPPNSEVSEQSLPPVPPNSPASEEEEEMGGGAKSKKYGKIELLSDTELAKTPYNNFYLLCSVGLYDQSITVKQKKAILQKMNQRPENVNGKLARIIVMDSGFKEGIDLFDIKYVHIFEPQVTAADQKQVIGRATRTCGQKGLEFHPMRGWPLHVYIYDIDIPQIFVYFLNIFRNLLFQLTNITCQILTHIFGVVFM